MKTWVLFLFHCCNVIFICCVLKKYCLFFQKGTARTCKAITFPSIIFQSFQFCHYFKVIVNFLGIFLSVWKSCCKFASNYILLLIKSFFNWELIQWWSLVLFLIWTHSNVNHHQGLTILQMSKLFSNCFCFLFSSLFIILSILLW